MAGDVLTRAQQLQQEADGLVSRFQARNDSERSFIALVRDFQTLTRDLVADLAAAQQDLQQCQALLLLIRAKAARRDLLNTPTEHRTIKPVDNIQLTFKQLTQVLGEDWRG